jgi:hypothetical protein
MNAVLVIVSLGLASVVYAQGLEPRNHSGAPGPGTFAPATITPAQEAQGETNRLARFFNLTSSQQTSVLGILTSADTQIQALDTQLDALQTTLLTAIKSNNSAQISSVLKQIFPLQEQIQTIRATAAGQIYATVLTSAQQAQVPNGLGPLFDGAY